LKLATGQDKLLVDIDEIKEQKLFYLAVGHLIFQN
jgi:hypothetical protein